MCVRLIGFAHIGPTFLYDASLINDLRNCYKISPSISRLTGMIFLFILILYNRHLRLLIYKQ